MNARAPELAGLAVATLLACATAVPYALAAVAPPQGRSFAGSFFFTDDFCQYLSFSEQASRGELLFRNKFDPRPHGPFLLNPGWAAAGGAGALLGNLAAGYDAVGALALLGFGAGVARLAHALGCRERSVLWAAILTLTAGGLEWLRHLEELPGGVSASVLLLFPGAQLLTLSSHSLLGLCLLTWMLILFRDWIRGERGAWTWVLAASILGLSRPFDFAVGVLVSALWLVVRPGASLADLRRRAPTLLWLAPVALYDAAAFLVHPSFGLWSGPQNVVPVPDLATLAWMLGPALLLAMPLGTAAPGEEGARRLVRVWAAVVVAGLLLPSVSFSLQFATSVGAALSLAAVAALPHRLLPVVAVALAPTTLALYGAVARPPALWFPPAEYRAAAAHLARECRPSQRVYAPSDPSLLIAAYASCDVLFGHRVLTPEFALRAEESEVFFDAATSPAWRLGYLERMGVDHVLLPVGRGSWLGGSERWRPSLRTGLLEVWTRVGSSPS